MGGEDSGVNRLGGVVERGGERRKVIERGRGVRGYGREGVRWGG